MSDTKAPCDSTEARQFDFWLGDWDLTWPAEQTGGQAGETAQGSNRVESLFGDCAIEENFATDGRGFLGRSLSVYDVRAGMWRQTWVDNTGGYLSLSGNYNGETMELRTAVVERKGDHFVQRMVFSNIEPDSLDWDWQNSVDGGENWQNIWAITYRRRI
jgi:hypothetical protein